MVALVKLNLHKTRDKRGRGRFYRVWYSIDGYLPRRLRPCRCLAYHARTGQHAYVCPRGTGDHPYAAKNGKRAWRILRMGW